MTERVLSCHFQLSSSLQAVFLLSHLSPPCYRKHLSASFHPWVFNLLSFLVVSSLSFTLSICLSCPCRLSLLWFPGFSDCVITLGVGGWGGWWGGGGVSSAWRDSLMRFILWKTFNLNADSNIFWWINSTVCNIPNTALFFVFTLLICYALCVFHKLLDLTNENH